MLSPTSRYFTGLIELCHAHDVGRSLALVHSASGTFGRSVIEGAAERAGELGFEIVFSETYPGEDDMPSLADRVAGQRLDIVLGAGSAGQDIAFACALMGCQHRPPVVGLVATPIQRFADEVGAGSDGFFGPSQWEEEVDYSPDLGPTSREFAARYGDRFGSAPDYPAAQSYVARLIIQHCLAAAGSLDEADLRAAATAADLTTFYGRFKLDPATGAQTGHDPVTVQRQGRRKGIVWPPDAANAEPILL